MNFTESRLVATVAASRHARNATVSNPIFDLPQAPAWQAALTLAPAVVAALGALVVPRAGGAAAWRRTRGVSALIVGMTLASMGALAVAGSGQAHGVRADLVGAVVGLLVAFVGWVIVRYSQPYLGGERGEAGYMRWLLATLAAVLLVVASNHLLVLALAWTATSLALHRLLTFFADRPAALAAAHKKFVLGRVADVAMLGACALLALEFDTLRIDALLAQAAALEALPAGVRIATLLIVAAVLLKCAQLPFHGWLIQVMEAPTPVSALLHAGVVNLGGFVLIRLAPLVAEVPAAAGLLVLAGTFTAVVAALVMTTRISIKVALAWSTCAQMGFMLLQCGLGLWEMALLHLVAHSLYKAHAFLGAGGVVRQTQVRQLAAAVPRAGIARQLAAAGAALAMTALAALAVTALLANVFGLHPATPPALWVAGGIVALALAPMVLGWPAGARRSSWLRAAATAFLLACIYFALHALLQGWVAPADAVPGAPWWAFVGVAFALLFALQSAVGARPQGALSKSLYPWFYGGLFLDERFSRAMFRLWPPPRPAGASAAASTPAAMADAA
jgi:formate hydrogenlyase subunit 3/multisubunit Na+/H+ antiporter MnhD subunit